jgi:TolB-like protein
LRYLFEDFTLDPDRRELLDAAVIVALEPKVFDLLVYLVRNRERVITKEDLIASVWDGRIVSESSLTGCINGARNAIGDNGDEQRLIKTLPRKGVRFIGDVREEPSSQLKGPHPVFSNTPSIAVLPFQVMGNVDLEGFTDGLTEDVITELSRIKGVWVIARNTMFTYKGRSIDVRTIASDLGVQYVLEGSVRGAEGRVRMTAQLIEAETGYHVWATKIDRDSTGLFDLQDDFTRCIVASVQTQVIVNEGKICTHRQSPHSGDLFSIANAGLYPPTAERLKNLVSVAEEVLAEDPNNGEACRLLAVGLWHQAYIGYIPWDPTTAEKVTLFAQRAVTFERANEYAHWTMALAHLMAGQHDRALVSLRCALDLNPNCSLAYGSIGTVLAWGGVPDESIANNEIALKINPSDPLNSHRHFGLALAHYLGFRYPKALEYAALAIQLRPEWWLAHITYVATLAQIGRTTDAQAACAVLRRLKPEMNVVSLNNLPFAKETDRNHLADGLRKAGLPGV